MTFPANFWKQPYSWQMGYISGKWQPAEKDTKPPDPNPCVEGTQPWRDWEAGFTAGKESIQRKGK